MVICSARREFLRWQIPLVVWKKVGGAEAVYTHICLSMNFCCPSPLETKFYVTVCLVPRKQFLNEHCTVLQYFPAGLAMLSVSELHTMCVEMRTKFQRLSELLISELQQRDQLVHEMDVRNRFISAMLRVQNRRHGLGVNGSTDGLLRGRARTWTTKSREERYSGKVECVTDQY